jgi:Ca-activated chloride channel family protein
MDEQKLDNILKNTTAPAPSKNAENQAVERAVAAFDKKFENISQGQAASGRLTGIGNFLNHVRRKIMNKKYVLSGLSGAVAACAIIAIIGPGFYQAEITRIAGGVETHAVTDASMPAPAEVKKEKAAVAVNEWRAGAAEMSGAAGSVADSLASAPVAESFVASPMAEPQRQQDVAGKRMMVQQDMAVSSSSMMIAPAPGIMPIPPYDMIMPSPEQGRDQFKSFEQNPVKQVSQEPVSTFSIDVDTASYGFVRKMLNGGQVPPADAVRIEELVNYFDYDYALPEKGEAPFKPTVAVYKSPWKQDAKIIHIGIKGYELTGVKPKSNLVFLIDTSGSMNQQDKLPLLRSSFKMMLDTLSPDDTVAIVTYAGSAGTALEPTKVSEKAKIIAALDTLHAGGGTAGEAGIRQAYALAEQVKADGGNNRIILATDGDFNVGINDPEQLKNFVAEKRAGGVFLSVLGFGAGNYNDHIMQSLAQNGNGNAAYIDSLNEARKVLVEESSSTLFTIAKDVKIQVEFNPAAVAEYRLVGYETRHLNREDFNNDKIDAGDIGAGHTVTAIYEITPVGAVPSIDPLRYGAVATAKPAAPAGNTDEYAFLKIRYKKPDSDTSILIDRSVTAADEKSFDQLSDDIRFAASVAGFGQLLKGGQHSGGQTMADVVAVANGARGKDEFGYRSEFVNLARLAQSLKK